MDGPELTLGISWSLSAVGPGSALPALPALRALRTLLGNRMKRFLDECRKRNTGLIQVKPFTLASRHIVVRGVRVPEYRPMRWSDLQCENITNELTEPREPRETRDSTESVESAESGDSTKSVESGEYSESGESDSSESTEDSTALAVSKPKSKARRAPRTLTFPEMKYQCPKFPKPKIFLRLARFGGLFGFGAYVEYLRYTAKRYGRAAAAWYHARLVGLMRRVFKRGLIQVHGTDVAYFHMKHATSAERSARNTRKSNKSNKSRKISAKSSRFGSPSDDELLDSEQEDDIPTKRPRTDETHKVLRRPDAAIDITDEEYDAIVKSKLGELVVIKGVRWVSIAEGGSCVVIAPEKGASVVAKVLKKNEDRDIKVDEEISMMLHDRLTAFVPKIHARIRLESGRTVGYTMEKFDMSLHDYMTAGHTGPSGPVGPVGPSGPTGLNEDLQEKVYNVIQGVCKVVSCFDIKPQNFVIRQGPKGPQASEWDVRMIDFGTDFCESDPRDDEETNDNVLFCVLLFCIASCEIGNDSYMRLDFFLRKLTDDRQKTESAMERVDWRLDRLMQTISFNSTQSKCFINGIGAAAAKRMRLGDTKKTARGVFTARCLLGSYLDKISPGGASREPRVSNVRAEGPRLGRAVN